jgi:hypothetical protein
VRPPAPTLVETGIDMDGDPVRIEHRIKRPRGRPKGAKDLRGLDPEIKLRRGLARGAKAYVTEATIGQPLRYALPSSLSAASVGREREPRPCRRSCSS